MSAFTEELKGAFREVIREELPRILRELQPPAAPTLAGDEGYLTVGQAAKLCALTPAVLREKCRAGEISAIRPGGGRGWRIRRDSFAAWLGQRQEPTGKVDIEAEARKIVASLRG